MRSDLRRIFFGIVLFVLLSLPLWATGEGPTSTKLVAVLDLRNDADLPQRDMDYLTEVVRTGARQALPLGAFKLMTKENITELLPPEKRNLKNCEGECEVETGRLLGANYLVTGTVTKFTGELRVTIRLYDVAGGDMLDSKKASAVKLKDLEPQIEQISETIFWPVPGARRPVTPTPLSAPYPTPQSNPQSIPQPPPQSSNTDMVYIQGGSFLMGCSPGDSECLDNETPAKTVNVGSFWMDKTEVTQSAYQQCVYAGRCKPVDENACYKYDGTSWKQGGALNSSFKGSNQPVVCVNWSESDNYCRWSGKRLPTEAEWEYSARGGTTDSRYGDLDTIAWYTKNSDNVTHVMGQKQANTYGLYDMLGNAWEWTSDWYDSKQTTRVLRGGGWYDGPRNVRASIRYRFVPTDRSFDYGFRCVRDD